MEDSPHLDISEIGDNEDMEEGGEEEEEEDEDDDDDDVHQGETDMQPDTMTSLCPDLHEPPNHVQRTPGEASPEETEIADDPAAALENLVECAEQYMLDVSGNISENLSFYMDGMIVSTSTVGGCEAPEIYSGSSALVGLDALILDAAQISQVLNTDSVAGQEIPGQPQVKRRTATPPLLPQIKTELESEVGVSSSSSSLVSSFVENLLPPNAESTGEQEERTVFLSPKLQRLLEKQDGLTPTRALTAEAQRPRSPVSLSVRFKRRTGSPPSSPQETPTAIDEAADSGDCDGVGAGRLESPWSSPGPQAADGKDDSPPRAEEPAVTPVSAESWTPPAGGNSCNQQPLDLSNAVGRNDDFAFRDSVLDLSFQKKMPGQSDPTVDLVSNACLAETALINTGEQNVSLWNPEIPLVTDFTIRTGPDVMTPMAPVAEGLVHGLAPPSNSLIASPASFPPVSLQPASPCTLECAGPASSFRTLLTPPNISDPASQPIPLLAAALSSEPLVVCADGALLFSECDLTTASAHVFLSDQIALSRPRVESIPMSEVQFPPAVSLSDSLLNSFLVSSSAVLIECTVALQAPARTVASPDAAAEPPAPTQMVAGHMERVVSVPGSQTVDPTILMSSLAASVSLSTLATSDCRSSPDPRPVADADSPLVKEEAAAASAVSIAEGSSKASEEEEEEEEDEDEDEDEDGVSSGAPPQTFTKNFICNVCDRLFHSMKALGHHVGDHADQWPYKCEFCVLLFGRASALLHHRSSLHGVATSYVCSACTKEFVYLCNLKQHQDELHPGLQCSYSEEEAGKLRPQNHNNSVTVKAEEPTKPVKREADVAAEELFTALKILASNGADVKGPDVRLGINQHYPSFKPPPFPYHNRSPAGSVASATSFTTHNIPQTFTTAIRCTKCGKSFDNMPELHKHILACANASDKRRYTPKRNPIPLRHFAKAQSGVLSTTNTTNGLNASNRPSQSNRAKPSREAPGKVKFKVLSKRKKKLVPRATPQRSKSPSNKMSPAAAQPEVFGCPHCSREFAMRRSRTKHTAVCPKKPTEVTKRKEGGVSVTKENDGRPHRRVEEKRHSSPRHQTRLQSSGPAKRPAILPVQTVFSSKRSKIIIKESSQPKEEAAALNDLPAARTFNPSMRQYSRAPHGLKGIPVGKPRAAAAPEPESDSGPSPTA